MADLKKPAAAAAQGGTHEQHVASGKQSNKNDAKDKSAKSGNTSAKSGKMPAPQDQTHEQHVAAGKQSHKND